MAADGRIIIDTLVHTDKAERSLTALRSQAKSTAQEIAATGKKLDALKGNTKLKEELEAAKEALQQMQAEAQGLHDMLPRVRGTEMEETAARWAAEAEDRAVKQALAVEKASAAYEQQQAQIQKLTQQHEELTARLQQEQAAADKAGARFRLGMGLKTFGGTLTGAAKQGAAGFGKLAASSLSFSRGMQSCEKSARRFNSRLRGIVSGALIFNVLSKALRTLTGTFGAALMKSAAFNQSLANLKGASATAAAPLMQALTPALTALANAAATAMGYVAQMVSFFTGKSIANMQATAKALTGVAGAGNEAAGSLAGFDELNVLSKDAGGAGSAGTAPNFGFTPGESPFWQSVTQAVKGGDWAGAGQLFADKMNALVDGFDASGWGTKLGRTLQNGLSVAGNFIRMFDWNAAGSQFAALCNGLFSAIDPADFGTVLVSRFTAAIRFFWGALADFDWASFGSWASGFVISVADQLTEALWSVDWYGIGENLADFVANIDWGGVIHSTALLVTSILLAALNLGAGFLSGAWDWLKQTFLDGFTMALDNPDEWGGVGVNIVTGILNGILSVLAGIFTWVWDNVFIPIKDAVCEAFGIHSPSTVAKGWGKNIVLGLMQGTIATLGAKSNGIRDALVNAFKSGINAVIDQINRFIGWLNRALSFSWDGFTIGSGKLAVNIPGGSMQLANLPTVPYLAQGAVIPPNREFLAVLGDQRSGTNIEAPEATLRKIMAEVLAEYGRSAPEQRDITVNLTAELDGEVIYRNQQKIKAGKGYPAGLNPAFA